MNCFERLASRCDWSDERSRTRGFDPRDGDCDGDVEGVGGESDRLFTSGKGARGEWLMGQPPPTEDRAEEQPSPSSDGGGVGIPLKNS